MSLPVESDGSLNESFSSFPISSFPPPPLGYIAVIDSDTPISLACRVLKDNKLLSAPVRNTGAPDSASWVDKYSFVIDYLGIIDWMMSNGKTPTTESELNELVESFKHTTVAEVAAQATWSRFVPIDPEEDSLLDVMCVLGKYGVHRVFVVDSMAQEITNVISQSAVVSFIYNNIASFSANVMTKSIGQLGVGINHEIVTVNQDDTFWEAFRKMKDNLVSAVAVVDKDSNKLIGNISSHDLQQMFSDNVKFHALPLTVGANEYHLRTPHPLSCTTDTPLAKVIEILALNHIHRVYVVDENQRPIGVVGLRDILARLVKEPANSNLWKYFSV